MRAKSYYELDNGHTMNADIFDILGQKTKLNPRKKLISLYASYNVDDYTGGRKNRLTKKSKRSNRRKSYRRLRK